MAKRKVVVTGAGGVVTNAILPALRERYDLVLLDVSKDTKSGYMEDIVETDLTDPDVETFREHFKGADTIIHNARVPNRGDPLYTTGPNHQWKADRPDHPVDGYIAERKNLDMAFHVYKMALQEGARRVVVASSNHAADWYETKLHCGEMDIIDPETTYPKSDNFYGWCKIAYEGIGFAFATGRFGRAIESVNIRIGAPRPLDIPKLAQNQVSLRRDLGAFISERDLQQLYVKSIETEDVTDADGVPFQAFYGISNNTRAFWSIANARRVIGYEPEDDSERIYADEIRQYLTEPGRTYSPRP
jgi:hypothetical protein